MRMFIAYAVCPALSCLILWLRQGRFLTDSQIPACIIFGPISLLIAVFAPSDLLTSREKSEGKGL